MYPELFRIPYFDFPISSFGVLMACGFLTAWWIVGKRFEEHGMDPDLSSTIVLYAAIGGILGSKLYFAIDVGLVRGQGEFLDLLLDRGGITWYGGLIGGILVTTIGTRIHEIPTRLVASTRPRRSSRSPRCAISGLDESVRAACSVSAALGSACNCAARTRTTASPTSTPTASKRVV